MKKKIGIITIQSMNFGNRLQNYALQEVLNRLGYEVYTMKRYNEELPLGERVVNFLKVVLQHCIRSKIIKFKEFDREILFSKYSVGKNRYPMNIAEKYDYFITGSDQVWNPYFKNVGKCDLLYFANNNQRISYAASFGVSELPDSVIRSWGVELDKFKKISVREKEGKTIVETISNKSADVVLDPTLLLEAKDWERIEARPKFAPSKPYVFVYALKEKNSAFEEKLRDLSKKYVVVDVLQRNKLGVSVKLGPREFLYLINHAEYVLTDSFHATVFSIIFNTKVHTFARTGMDMNSRIKSLAKIVGLENSFDNYQTFNYNPSLDSQTVQTNLSISKDKSIMYLKQALE